MTIARVLIVSPPFSSQVTAAVELASEFIEEGIEAVVATDDGFEEKVTVRGAGFVRLVTSSNSNTGIAVKTR